VAFGHSHPLVKASVQYFWNSRSFSISICIGFLFHF
jgi:hypothetical protein